MSIMLDKIKMFYGTCTSKNKTVDSVVKAVSLGYVAIDTAQGYGYYSNHTYVSAETEVGSALKILNDLGYQREKIFLQTKYYYPWPKESVDGNKTAIKEDVLKHFDESLQKLGTNVDSLLLHAPYDDDVLSENDLFVWEVFEQLLMKGKLSYIGVSNFNFVQLQELIAKSYIKPMILQNFYGIGQFEVGEDMMHPHQILDWLKKYALEKNKLLCLCQKNKIQFQSFNNKIAEEKLPIANKILQKYNMSLKQLIYKFEEVLGIVPITGTTNEAHMEENINIDKLDLESADVNLLIGEQKSYKMEEL